MSAELSRPELLRAVAAILVAGVGIAVVFALVFALAVGEQHVAPWMASGVQGEQAWITAQNAQAVDVMKGYEAMGDSIRASMSSARPLGLLSLQSVSYRRAGTGIGQ